ncbi:hypothetical protein PAEPH01_0749 [Pancytospora epiphaga]|nr:hypothetical protein PAEPH01_0749 [Pancytospora epiphaga]
MQTVLKNFEFCSCMDDLRKNMDDLVKRLRTSQKAPIPSEEKQDTTHIVHPDIASTVCSTSEPGTFKEVFNLATSQIERSGSRFQLDFDLLRKHREEDPEHKYITAAEVRITPLYKIDRYFFSILKSVELFGCGVHKWELWDETGIVFGSALVQDGTASIGDIVCLSNSSLWKIDGNHLNIVDSNIIKVIRFRQ